MYNVWWDGHDSRTRAYFFWKWEYDRRNYTYCRDYFRTISTGKPSSEYFHKTYKHSHLDPIKGHDITDILCAALMSNKHCPFEPYPPDDLYLDELGEDGHHKEEECIHFIMTDKSILFNINPNLDLASHIKVLQDNFEKIVNEWKQSTITTTQYSFPLAALKGLYVPKGYRHKDNYIERAIGLKLYDLEIKGMRLQQSLKFLTNQYEYFKTTDKDEKTFQRYLRATRDCVKLHEVLPLS